MSDRGTPPVPGAARNLGFPYGTGVVHYTFERKAVRVMTLLDTIRRETVAPPPPPAPVTHQGVLFVGGLMPLAWNTADPASVVRAKSQFDRAILSGYMGQVYKAQTVTSPWGGSAMGMSYAGEVSREFDPEADEIRMSLPYAGG